MSLNRLLQSRLSPLLLSPNSVAWLHSWRHRHFKQRHSEPSLALFFDSADPVSHFALGLLPQLQQRYGLPIFVYLLPPPAADVVKDLPQYRAYALSDVKRMAAYYGVAGWQQVSPPSLAQVEHFNQIMVGVQRAEDFFLQAAPLSQAMWCADAVQFQKHAHAYHSASNVSVTLQEHAQLQRQLGHYLGGQFYFNGEWFGALDRLHHLHDRLATSGHGGGQWDLLQPQPAIQMEGRHTHEIDFFFSFRSPYSYLAVSQIQTLVDRYDLHLHVRPILPMVMRGVPLPRVKQLYIMSDCLREAKLKQIPFGPVCDPLGRGVERCLKLFEFAQQQNRALEFVTAVSRGVWSEGLDVSRDKVLATILERIGLDWKQASAAEFNSSCEQRVRDNSVALQDLGLWGVPAFKFGHLRCWGQDRIPLIEAVCRAQWQVPPQSHAGISSSA